MITGLRMPANLPPDAKAKWHDVTQTKNPETRLQLMGEFLSLVPKHKGTEKMCAQVKRQMAQIRDEIEEKKKAAKKKLARIGMRCNSSVFSTLARASTQTANQINCSRWFCITRH